MAEAKLQMATDSGTWGWKFPFLFYTLLYSLNFFSHITNFTLIKTTTTTKTKTKKCYSKVCGFLLVFPRQGRWQGGHKRGWFTAPEHVKGTGIGTGSQSISLWGLAWCQYHVYPECPRLLSTMQLIRLARLLSMPARLEAFLIHPRDMGPPVVTCLMIVR